MTSDRTHAAQSGVHLRYTRPPMHSTQASILSLDNSSFAPHIRCVCHVRRIAVERARWVSQGSGPPHCKPQWLHAGQSACQLGEVIIRASIRNWECAHGMRFVSAPLGLVCSVYQILFLRQL